VVVAGLRGIVEVIIESGVFEGEDLELSLLELVGPTECQEYGVVATGLTGTVLVVDGNVATGSVVFGVEGPVFPSPRAFVPTGSQYCGGGAQVAPGGQGST
jgi:hypothetical protein